MADHNSGAFSGRIAKMDVKRLQSKSEKSGTVALANVTLAVNYYSRKDKQEKPMYIKLRIVGKQAENLEQYKNVGDQLIVDGKWEPNEWKSNAGEKHSELVLVVNNVAYGRNKGDRPTNGSTGTNTSAPSQGGKEDYPMDGYYPMDEELGDDDLPF